MQSKNDVNSNLGFEDLLEDYSRQPVPDSKTISGWRVGLIIIGVAITIPAFLTGMHVGSALGLHQALIAFIAGSSLITAIACFTGSVGAVSRLSTSMILRFSFGNQGANMVSLFIGLTTLGWYGVTAELFGQAIQNMLLSLWGVDFPLVPLIIFGSILMIATTVFGFKALDKLSLFAVPLMVLFLSAVVFIVLTGPPPADTVAGLMSQLSMGQAISAVAGTYMVGVTNFPDMCRYTRNASQAVLASVIGFLIGFPAVLIASAVTGVFTGESDFLLMLGLLGLGLPGFIMVVFATWTSNINNLYSSSLFFAPVFNRMDKWKIVIFAGIAGSAVAGFGITDFFLPFLLFLGVAVPPIAGIYVADFFMSKRRYSIETLESRPAVVTPAFVVWLVSFGLGYSAVEGYIRLTGVPACDAILAAFILTCLLRLYAKKWRAKLRNSVSVT